jgi:hypothetical protein
MSSNTIKKLLLSLIVVGVLASFTARGTFAVFNSSTKNPASIATGSILMTNSVGGGSNCYSDLTAANKNVNTGCTQPFSTTTLYPVLSSTAPTPPQTTVAYADVTITSAGLPVSTNSTLPATLMLYMPNCDASNNATAGAYLGGGNPCCPGDAFGAGVLPASAGNCPTTPSHSLDFFIQEYNAGFTTPYSSCVYPANGSTACTFLDDTLGSFFGNYHDVSHYFSLGSIAAGATRYFRIGVAEPIDDVGNYLQGETATFSLYWHMEQQ